MISLSAVRYSSLALQSSCLHVQIELGHCHSRSESCDPLGQRHGSAIFLASALIRGAGQEDRSSGNENETVPLAIAHAH